MIFLFFFSLFSEVKAAGPRLVFWPTGSRGLSMGLWPTPTNRASMRNRYYKHSYKMDIELTK